MDKIVTGTVDCIVDSYSPLRRAELFLHGSIRLRHPATSRYPDSAARCLYGCGLTLFFAWGAAGLLGAEDRWEGRLADGSLVKAESIADWFEPTAVPTVASRQVFDAGNPFVSLVDLQSQVATPAAYVEFVGGDRLAGEVQAARTGAASPYETAVPHLLVRSLSQFAAPEDGTQQPLRVSLRWVRRVVLQALGEIPYTPATVWLRGGGQLPYRSLRWNGDGVTVLTDEGQRSFPLLDLAEIHLPPADDWTAYVEQLTLLTPQLESRIMQLDLVDGCRFTTSLERFQARHWGDRKRSESWLQLVQPAWALDALWVRFPAIAGWRWFPATEPPLSWARPAAIQRDAVFGGSWTWQVDRNALKQPLTLGQQRRSRGFGVHGSTDLTFELPHFARELRAVCGLDAAAGAGGSVQLSVLGPDGTARFQTDPLIGSSRVLDTGWLTLNLSGNSRRFTLRSDMLRDNAPRGADPFDIRDIVGWGDVVLKLDRETLLADMTERRDPLTWNALGWNLAAEDRAAIHWRNWLDTTHSQFPQYRTLWSTTRPFAVLNRSVRVAAADRWLSLVVARFEGNSEATQIQIKIDGRSAGEFEIPVRQGPIDPLPITVPLPTGPARSVELQVVVYAPSADCWWEWRAAVPTPERPGIRMIYDEGKPDWLPVAANDLAQIDTEQAFAGRDSIRLNAGRVEVPHADPLTASIAELPKLGQYRFLTFAWKGTQTSGLSLGLAHDGRFGADIAGQMGLAPAAGGGPRFRAGTRLEDRGLRHGFTYDIGSYRPMELAPLRIDRKVPEAWRLEVRDLVRDFGEMQLTGLALGCLESGTGWFDALALARTPEDAEALRREFQQGTALRSDDVHSRMAVTRDEWGPAIAEFAPEFAAPKAIHGVLQKRLHQGQAGGWQTHPEERDRPFVLRTVHRFPDEEPQELDLLVSHSPGSDFRLVVRVDGEQVAEHLINDTLTTPQRGWASLQVDLSPYRGRTSLVEVWNAANDWSNEYAVWKRVQFRSR